MFVVLAWAGSAVLAWVLVRLALNHRRLRSFPGPFLASCTDIWMFVHQWSDKSWNTITTELHYQYGPVVRYGPNSLSFSDPAALATIYGLHPVLEKSKHYLSLTKVNKGKEVISFNTLTDEKRASAIKRSVASGFAPSALLNYEHCVDETAALLVKKLSERNQVDAADWMAYFTTDTLCRIAFSEDAGCLKTGTDATGFIANAEDRLRHWATWCVLPESDRMIFRNPLILQFLQFSSPVAAMATKKMKAPKSLSKDSPPDLLQRYIEASEKSPDIIGPRDVMALTMSTITAGASTTGNTTAIALYQLAKNPTKLAELEEELAEAIAAGELSDPPKLEEVNHLRYLDAVVKETMRLSPTTDHGIWRVTPPGGIDIAGTYVPGGTVVEGNMTLIHKDKRTYGEDADTFNPNRWIEADDDKRRAMERAWFSFGAGKRICLGQNIALLEIKKLLPLLAMRFRIRLVDPSYELKLSSSFVSKPIGLMMRFESKSADR